MTLGILMRATKSLRCFMTAKAIRLTLYKKYVWLTLSRLVFAEQNGQLSENTHVRALQAQSSFQKTDDLLEVPAAFI